MKVFCASIKVCFLLFYYWLRWITAGQHLPSANLVFPSLLALQGFQVNKYFHFLILSSMDLIFQIIFFHICVFFLLQNLSFQSSTWLGPFSEFYFSASSTFRCVWITWRSNESADSDSGALGWGFTLPFQWAPRKCHCSMLEAGALGWGFTLPFQ